MKLSKFKKVMHFLWRCSVTENKNMKEKLVPFIWGAHGQGKSSIVREFAEEVGAKLILLYTASQDPGDLIGIPETKVTENGDHVTFWPRPEWLPHQSDEGKYIIFLDELNRARQDVLQCMLPFSLEGVLHTHTVPKNTMIIAAGNPDNDNYQVTSIEDEALLSRFGHYCLENNKDEWVEYVKKDGHYDSCLLNAVIKDNYAGLNNKPIELPFKTSADPRSLYLLCKKIPYMTEEELKEIGKDVIAAHTDVHTAVLWGKELENELDVIRPDDILNNYNENVINKIKKYTNLRTKVGIRNDIIAQACTSLMLVLKEMSSLTKDQTNNLIKFTLLLPEGRMRAWLEQIWNEKSSIFPKLLEDMSSSNLMNDKGKKITDILYELAD